MSSLNLKWGKTFHGWKRKRKSFVDTQMLEFSNMDSVAGVSLTSLDHMVTDRVLHGVLLGCRECTVTHSKFIGFTNKTSEMIRLQWPKSFMHCIICKLDLLVIYSANNQQIVSSAVY